MQTSNNFMEKQKSKFIIFLLISICIFSICCTANADDTPYGIGTFLSWNHEWNNYMYKNEEEIDKSVKILKDLGISIVRNEFSWNEIEVTKGTFNFERYDYIVKVCQQNNIEILGILGFTAPWTGQQWNSAPQDEALFLNYVETVVNRYKDSIKYWEFWNEPDSPIYWNPQDDMKAYTDLLKKVYTAIKKVNPSAVVVLGGLTQTPYFSLKRILSYGGGNYFDVFNFHPYSNPQNNEGIKRITSLLNNITKELDKKNLNKKIWISEIACPGTNQSDSCAWWIGECQNENQQAEFLKEVYSLLTTHENMEKIFWSMFRDTDHFKDGIDYFGLIRWDYTPKPAYSTYKQIIENWDKDLKK